MTIQRNDVHEYNFGITIRFVGNSVIVSKGDEVIATNKKTTEANSKTRKIADFFYKSHILNTYDDPNRIKLTGYKGYFAEYSPQPGMMLRVTNSNTPGFRRFVVSAPGYKAIKRVWVKDGERIVSVLKRNFS